MTTYRVISVTKTGKLVNSFQCCDMLEVAALISKIEQAGMDARCWTEKN
jgi:hypothetical protein